jgi:hypothetical protein
MSSIHTKLKSPRRVFLKILGGSIPAALVLRAPLQAAGAIRTVRIVEFDASGVRTRVEEVEKVEKPLADWKKQLTPEQIHGRPSGGNGTPR